MTFEGIEIENNKFKGITLESVKPDEVLTEAEDGTKEKIIKKITAEYKLEFQELTTAEKNSLMALFLDKYLANSKLNIAEIFSSYFNLGLGTIFEFDYSSISNKKKDNFNFEISLKINVQALIICTKVHVLQ